jgi:hypothetical protein
MPVASSHAPAAAHSSFGNMLAGPKLHNASITARSGVESRILRSVFVRIVRQAGFCQIAGVICDGQPKNTQPIKLVVRHAVPSLNRLFAMNPWQRLAEKRATQYAFMYALSVFGESSATRITFVQNTLSTASARRVLSVMTPQNTLPLKWRRKKSEQKLMNAPKSL